MRLLKNSLFIICIISFLSSDPFKLLDTDFLNQETVSKKTVVKPEAPKIVKKKGLPSYDEVIKDFKKIDGLFIMFWNKEKNRLLMEINPAKHYGMTFLANMTRTAGDAMYYDGGSLLWEFPFRLDEHNGEIRIIHINTLFRADESSPMNDLIKRNFSNSIYASSKILSSKNNDGSFIIDANSLFLNDINYVSQNRKGKYIFDEKNSSFSLVQSFPYNTEIGILAHYKSRKWTDTYTLPNSHSMFHRYHLSLSVLPNNDFSSRKSDDRIGYFTTIFQDYSDALKDSPYVRYINKWNLKKNFDLTINPTYSYNNQLPTVPIQNKKQFLYEPIEPIVYWIENTVPYEFRNAIKEGVLAWNIAFENIGFKNAIVVKQMPDDAEWDPGDVRYNTIRWFVQPGSAYAVGPSRANPMTGEIYDADIRISADFVRAYYREYDEFVSPLIFDDPISAWEAEEKEHLNHSQCNYSNHLKNQMILSWHALVSNGLVENNEKNLKEYVHDGLVDLVLHEVGHTLGLRHNFKASSIFSVEQLSNPEFTKKYGISGSVMDYHSVSLLDNGHTMFQTKPGPYDLWAIEYGYSDEPQINENLLLEDIASKSNNPYLVYGTDEDAFGLSSRGIDPLCSVWDMSSNPIEYYSKQIELVQNLWNDLLINFEKKGTRYQKLRSVFSQGISEYRSAARTACKFVGGIHFSRNHIGDPGNQDPLIVANPKEQREALNFLFDKIFGENAFSFNPNLLNKLSPERNDDFRGYVWSMDRLDHPLHRIINRVQATGLYSLFHPRRLARIQDNELRYIESDKFTMHELFVSTTNALWAELDSEKNINSFRRDLQTTYIKLLEVIIINQDSSIPNDAKILSRASLKSILKKVYNSLSSIKIDNYTKAHLENSAEYIESILDAKITLN